MRKFFLSLLSSETIVSSKRFVTLIIAFHFIITAFLVSFFVFYLIIYTPKGAVNKDLIDTLMVIFEYDFYIILSGLGFITITDLRSILIERAKAKIGIPPPILGQSAPPDSLTIDNNKATKVDSDELNK